MRFFEFATSGGTAASNVAVAINSVTDASCILQPETNSNINYKRKKPVILKRSPDLEVLDK